MKPQQLPKAFRSLLRLIVFGSGGVLGLQLAIALAIVETLIHPKRRTLFDLYTLSPYEFGCPAEAVAFPPLRGNYQVNGWYLSHPEATTTLLVCPGYRCETSYVMAMAAMLWRAGHNVLVFEYYGHGTPVGVPVTLGYREMNDFYGAMTYARRRAPQAGLGVLAYSMGAAVALMCSARTRAIEALVVDSPFATHRSVIAYHLRRTCHLPFALVSGMTDGVLWWRAGYHLHQVEPLRDIGRIAPRPLLIIQGGRDSVVDPHDASLLYEAAGEPKALWFLPEAEHCAAYFLNRDAYVQKIKTFFERHLQPHKHVCHLLGSDGTARQRASSAVILASSPERGCRYGTGVVSDSRRRAS